ncbi:MAG: sugar ABC transporter permease, partial [Chloroflexota bacterium]
RWMLSTASIAFLSLIAGAWVMNLTLSEVNTAIADALADGETLPIWSQTIMISAGAGLMGIALWLWNRTVHDQNARFYVMKLLAVVSAIVGSVFLVQYLPQAFQAADEEVFMGFSVTVWYSLLSVPFQLTLGLLLAVLLFQKIRLKSFFRIVFFMPYITPFVATSVVFALLFSPSESSLVNQFIGFFGIEEQAWLREPQGIIQLMFGDIIPDWAAGPSLALLVIIIYNIWIYAGFSSVIFLAGLGGIPEDVYEAAEIDGATGWQQFRHITIPLLSPTTFFLTLIATIGTFQAFTQIFLMRREGAFEAVNTINLYIYDEINQSTPNYAYGSAMAFVLFAVILILTIWQNRIAERRVFYG